MDTGRRFHDSGVFRASSAELMASALRDTQDLAKGYIDLGRIELAKHVNEARRHVTMLLTGLTVLVVSLPFLIWGGGMALAQALDVRPWVGILPVAGAVAVAGLVTLAIARPDKLEPEDIPAPGSS